MGADNQFECFAVSQPGIEPLLYQELKELGLVKDPKADFIPGEGGVSFHSPLEGIYRTNLWLRTANRVLLRLGRFHAVHLAELRYKAGDLPWEKFLLPGQPVSIRATCHHSKLYHSGAVSERIAGAINDHFKKSIKVVPYNDDLPEAQLILVRMDHDECMVSIDTSGEPLHRRGYRLALAKAPLRETLAVAMILAAGWDRNSLLLDPFCGSGVIPIEAAMLAGRIAPGVGRKFSFMNFPGFQETIWKDALTKAVGGIHPPASPILGSDRDAGAVQAARDNANRAGVGEWIEFRQAAISAIHPPDSPHGWVVTNPPYGVRISSGNDLRALYTQFGQVLRQYCPGWQVAYLCNDERLATQTRLIFGKGLSMNNGGIPVKLTRATVQTG